MIFIFLLVILSANIKILTAIEKHFSRMSSQLPPGAKGRLVPPRRTKKPNRKQRRETDKENAISRGKNILGSEQWESMRAQWSNYL